MFIKEKNTYVFQKLEAYTEDELVARERELLEAIGHEIEQVTTEAEYEAFRIRWVGDKNGHLRNLMRYWIAAAPSSFKARVGAVVNDLKVKITQGVNRANSRWRDLALLAKLPLSATGYIDVTLPGIRRVLGAEHPIVKTSNEMIGIFKRMGYSVAEGPEIESDYYNFEALNFPPNHPARDTQDTLFVAGQQAKPQRERLLLRTHTSPVQIRAMEKQPPPIRIVVPGKVHRHDTPDASHSPIFHQIEGLAVDANITFCDLKGTLDHAMKEMFGSSVRTRFYPSFFPFTEPSADVQISCFKCGGKGCALCKKSGWIEVLGCGMVDPHVFEFVRKSGYDPAKVSGFAFGMGVERIAILKYGIDDIQLFFNGDVRFLEQFA